MSCRLRPLAGHSADTPLVPALEEKYERSRKSLRTERFVDRAEWRADPRACTGLRSRLPMSRDQSPERTFSMIRRIFLVVLIFCGSTVRGQGTGSVTAPQLTLEEAISIAESNNRQIKNATLAVSIDDDQVAEARTYRFPSMNVHALGSQLLTPVDFIFSKGAFGNFSGIGPVPATDTTIYTPLRPTFYGLMQVSQPLSQQHQIGLNVRLAKLTKLVDEEKLRVHRCRLVRSGIHVHRRRKWIQMFWSWGQAQPG
jgi:hypothetical protein